MRLLALLGWLLAFTLAAVIATALLGYTSVCRVP
jgi:hypothetical protein